MSDTTTDTPEVTGAQEAQPEATEQVAAVEQQPAPAEESKDTEAPQETQEPSSDDNSEWLKSKGIDPTDPEAINKLAKSAREAEKAMHAKSQKASELEKTMGEMSDSSAEQVAEATGQDPELLKRLQRIEVRDAKRDFFSQNPDAAQYESEMAKIATEAGLYGTPESIMKAAYAMAKVNDSSLSTKAKQDTLKNLAQKQQSAVPQGNAVTTGSAPQEKEFNTLSIKEMESKLGFAKQ